MNGSRGRFKPAHLAQNTGNGNETRDKQETAQQQKWRLKACCMLHPHAKRAYGVQHTEARCRSGWNGRNVPFMRWNQMPPAVPSTMALLRPGHGMSMAAVRAARAR